jgi:DNA-binding GntR family transcriptional regulator
VFEHLRGHPDHAYTAAELAKEFDTDHRTMRAVLARLADRGLIDKKGDYWFALSDEAAAAKRAFLRMSRELDERHGREDPSDWPAVHQPDP